MIKRSNLQLLCAAILVMFFICFNDASAQDKSEGKAHKAEGKTKKEFCGDNHNWNNEKAGFKELREMTVNASGTLTVDGGKNGGISVKGENRSDILVRACVQTWGTTTEAAQAAAKAITINTGGTIKAEGAGDDWGVSYQILVPRNIDLNLTGQNGGLSVYAVDGNLELKTQNGGLHLAEIAGSVKGRTTNGGVHLALSGSNWKGSGIDLETTNGGVHLSVPQSFAANFEASTVNGGFHSDFNELSLPKAENGERKRPGGRVTASVNGGGAPVRLITTNGGVHISSQSEKATM